MSGKNIFLRCRYIRADYSKKIFRTSLLVGVFLFLVIFCKSEDLSATLAMCISR